MLNLKAEAAAAIEEPDGQTVSEVSLNGRISRCRADTAGHCSRLGPKTGLLALFGVRSQGHSFPESAPSGCPSGECWPSCYRMSRDGQRSRRISSPQVI